MRYVLRMVGTEVKKWEGGYMWGASEVAECNPSGVGGGSAVSGFG